MTNIGSVFPVGINVGTGGAGLFGLGGLTGATIGYCSEGSARNSPNPAYGLSNSVPLRFNAVGVFP